MANNRLTHPKTLAFLIICTVIIIFQYIMITFVCSQAPVPPNKVEPYEHCLLESCIDWKRCGIDANSFRFFLYNTSDMQASTEVDPNENFHQPDLSLPYFSALGRSKWRTNDPNEACLFFATLSDTFCWYNLCNGAESSGLSKLEYWNGGKNHVIIQMSDFDRLPAISMYSAGLTGVHRAGFDITIPLPNQLQFAPKQRHITPDNRAILCSFRGGRGAHKELRNRMRNLHEGFDQNLSYDGRVVYITTCHPRDYDEKCKDDWEFAANSTDASTLLTTSQYGLVPRGAGLHSYRLLETMAAGAIPVLLGDGFVLPLDDAIDWDQVIVRIPESQWHDIPAILRAMPAKRRDELYKNVVCVFETLLYCRQRYMDAVIEVLRHRLYQHSLEMSDVTSDCSPVSRWLLNNIDQ